jgi:hypothetical protein
MRTLIDRMSVHLRKSQKVRSIDLDEARREAASGVYDYYIAHGYGSRKVDVERQEATKALYDKSIEKNPGKAPIFFLCGYDFPKSLLDNHFTHLYGHFHLEQIERLFSENDSLKGRRDRFPNEDRLEIAVAHNSVENVHEIAYRADQSKRVLLYVTTKNHVQRLKYITDVFFGRSDKIDRVDIVGIDTETETLRDKIDNAWNKFYETCIAMPTTRWLLRGLKGKSPDEIVDIYNKRRYHSLPMLVGRLLKSHLRSQNAGKSPR